MKTEYRKFLEDKTRLINRLWLTDAQKEKLKTFFQMHPNWENKIDWNKKDLRWEDFQDVLALEGTSKNSKKKYGLSGKAKIEDLVLNKDYKVIFENNHCIIYYPLTFKASEVLAKPTTPPVGVQGKWCIAGKNYSPGTQDQHWNNYLDQKIDFFFIFTKDKYLINPATVVKKEEDLPYMLDVLQDATDSYNITKFGFRLNSKYALARRSSLTWQIFNSNDNCIFSRSPAELIEQFPAFKEIVEAINNQPNEVLSSRYWTDPETGALYSADKRKLYMLRSQDFQVYSGSKVFKVPDEVVGIGNRAFCNISGLDEVYIPDSVAYIGTKAFYNTEVKTLYIGTGVTSVSDEAFTYFTGKVVFTGDEKGTRKDIPPEMFMASSITELELPDSVLSIGYEAFSDTESLKIAKFSKNLKVIGAGAFSNARLLAFNLPDTVEKIETGAFRQNLFTHVTLPPKIKEVYPRTFSGCPNLKSVIINEGCTKIDHGAFANCIRLNAITIPASVTEIGNRAFYNCPLRQIYYTGTKEQWEDLLRTCESSIDLLYTGPGWEHPEEKVAFI